MATTLDFLAQCLDRRGWTYELDRAQNHIVTGVNAENVDRFIVLLQLSEAGEFLQFVAPQLVRVKDHVYKGVVFKTLLNISYQVKLLRFEYDPTDGEVRAAIELPLEDAPLTERLFDRCLSGLIQLVDQQAMPRIKTVLATGEDPGHKDLTALLAEGMPAEMMALLEQVLAAAKRQQS